MIEKVKYNIHRKMSRQREVREFWGERRGELDKIKQIFKNIFAVTRHIIIEWIHTTFFFHISSLYGWFYPCGAFSCPLSEPYEAIQNFTLTKISIKTYFYRKNIRDVLPMILLQVQQPSITKKTNVSCSNIRGIM